MTEPAQETLWCACGSLVVNRHGRCATCDRRRRLSAEDFGGLRDAALERDGYRCRNCAALDDVLVHHRRPGVNVLRWLIALCRGCHSRVHATWRPAYGFPALLLQLWREVHRDIAEQRALPLLAETPLAEQQSLISAESPTIQNEPGWIDVGAVMVLHGGNDGTRTACVGS